MQVTDSFLAFLRELQAPNKNDSVIPDVPWLVQLNIDPENSLLEVRLYNGSPESICFRRDYCLGVNADDQGELTLGASLGDLEDVCGLWPLWSDSNARRRAKEVPLPFAQAFLRNALATQDGHEICLQLIVADATGNSSDERSMVFRLGVDTCVLDANIP